MSMRHRTNDRSEPYIKIKIYRERQRESITTEYVKSFFYLMSLNVQRF